VDLTPFTLGGTFVTLEPIEERHAPDLFAAMQDEEVCRYLAWPPPVKLDETLTLIRDARAVMARGQSILDDEWPAVKARLQARLSGPGTATSGR